MPVEMCLQNALLLAWLCSCLRRLLDAAYMQVVGTKLLLFRIKIRPILQLTLALFLSSSSYIVGLGLRVIRSPIRVDGGLIALNF